MSLSAFGRIHYRIQLSNNWILVRNQQERNVICYKDDYVNDYCFLRVLCISSLQIYRSCRTLLIKINDWIFYIEVGINKDVALQAYDVYLFVYHWKFIRQKLQLTPFEASALGQSMFASLYYLLIQTSEYEQKQQTKLVKLHLSENKLSSSFSERCNLTLD